MQNKFLKFPENFLWGTSTSAHQTEGDCKNNDWSHHTFEKYQDRLPWMAKALKQIPDVGSACDSFNKYSRDYDFIEKMNNNSYRMSVEWARIEPKPGEFDQKTIDHYRKMLEDLKKRNIKVMLTLHHFTNPDWFILKKGWEKSKNTKYFLEFVEFVIKNLGDLVDFWITFNEPDVYMYCSYFQGWWPPMKKKKLLGWKVFFNLARTHKRAYFLIHKIIKEKFDQKPKVGIANSLQAYQSFVKHRFFDHFQVYWKYKIFNNSFYSLSNIKSHDFLGVNYYFSVDLTGRKLKRMVIQPDQGRPVTDMNWQIYPNGIYEVLVDLLPYQKPVYITENGIATTDEALRKKFIKEHLKQIYHAIKIGVDARGYFYWSLLDNYEWAEGYKPKFGLVKVDFDTKQRQLKKSGEYYAKIAEQNSIEID